MGTALSIDAIALNNTGLTASNATLTLPASLGSTTATIAQIVISDQGLSFGDAGLEVDLPNFTVGSKLSFAQNHASLAISGATYRLVVSAQMTSSLPGNVQTSAISLMMVTDGSDVQLSGTLSALTINLAGGTLTMSSLALSRDGLTVGAATYVLPTSLGGSIAVSGVRITRSDLAFNQGTLRLPPITFGGDGTRLALTDGQATLAVQNGLYTLAGSGKLKITLSGNDVPSSTLAFSISSGGQFSASLSQLDLIVAGSALKLTAVTITNAGLSTTTATLRMPERYNSPEATLTNVSITKAGLRLGGASISLNKSIRFGAQLEIAAPRLSLLVLPDGYSFQASGTLVATLPGNPINTLVTFQIDTNGNFKGSIQALDLKIAGTTLALRALQLESEAFRCAVAIQAPLDPRAWLQPPLEDFGPGGADSPAGVGLNNRRPFRPPPPVNFLQEAQRAFLGQGQQLKSERAVQRTVEQLTKPVMLVVDSPRDRMIAAQNSDLRSKLKRLGRPAEYVEVGSGFGENIPGAKAKLFRQMEEFFNLNLYDYNVKIGPTKEVK